MNANILSLERYNKAGIHKGINKKSEIDLYVCYWSLRV